MEYLRQLTHQPKDQCQRNGHAEWCRHLCLRNDVFQLITHPRATKQQEMTFWLREFLCQGASLGGTYWIVSIESYSKSSQTGKEFFLYISEKKENSVSKQKL